MAIKLVPYVLWASLGPWAFVSALRAQPTPYTDQSVLVLPVGVNTLTVTDSGALNSGSQTIPFGNASNEMAKVWLSVSGLPTRGSESAFFNTAGISLDMDWGGVPYYYEVWDAANSTKLRSSSRVTLRAVNGAATTSPFVVPFSVFGSSGKTRGFTFPVGSGQNINGLRVWIWAQKLARGKLGVWTNANPTKTLSVTSVIRVQSNGSGTCTLTTGAAHGLTTGDTPQLNFFQYPYGIANMNGTKTVTVTDSTRVTFPCLQAGGTAYPAGDYNATNSEVGSLGIPSPNIGDYGKTISKIVNYSDEQRYFGGMDNDGSSIRFMAPLSSGEIVAGQNNTLFFQYNGAIYGGHIGQWILDWNIAEPDLEIDQITIAGGDPLHATAHIKTGTHPYSVGDTVLIQSAPGPIWRFDDERIITAVPDNTHFSFLWGPDTDGFIKYAGLTRAPSVTPGDAYYTAPGTYVVPTSVLPEVYQQPHMYAARLVIPKSSMAAWNPAGDRVPAGNAIHGGTLYNGTATKSRSPYFGNNQSLAKCVDCHTDAGYDFKYFNAPTDLIKAGAIERGFSVSDAEDIVTYIKANATTPPVRARWWNPPYQPCGAMALSAANILQWAAGCGIDEINTYDNDEAEQMGNFSTWAASGNIDWRTIRRPYEFPSWTLWLPKFHPLDTFRFAGLDFTTTLAWTHYQTYKTGLKAAAPGNEYPTYRGFANRYMANFLPNGSDASTIKQTVFADQAVGRPNTPLASAPSYAPPAVWGLTGEGINNWFITRGWELNHQPLNGNSGLEGFLGRTYTDIDVDNSGSYPILSARCPTCAPYVFYGWYAAAAFDTGPHKSGPGASPAYRDNPWGQISGHSHTTLSEKWYKLQLLINNGNRILTGEFTEDCPYLYAYSNQMSEMRPSAWLSWENNAMIPQATWGAVSSATDVSQGNSINDTYISTDDPFNQQLWNNFVTQGDVQAQMGRVASQYQEFIARFTNNSGTAARFPCVGGPTPKFVYTHSISTFCSVVALALEVFSYYNNGCNATGNGCVAGSPTNAQITAIVGWADAVWPGNNFSQYSTMGNTCAFTTSVPPNLKCANWN